MPTTKLTPREARLLKSLLAQPLTREEADTIAEASNGPHYIGLLRRKGLVIDCDRKSRKFRNKDGFVVQPGTYQLKPESRQKALELLKAPEQGSKGGPNHAA
jgi:hypothetical protein